MNVEHEQPFTRRLSHGKTAIFILCQADVEDNHTEIVERYTEISQLYGYDLRVIRTTGLMGGAPDGDVSAAQKEAVGLAYEFCEE